jgi:hypothetical protein
MQEMISSTKELEKDAVYSIGFGITQLFLCLLGV